MPPGTFLSLLWRHRQALYLLSLGAAAKYNCVDWLNETVSKLAVQTEELEADLEALAPDKPKPGKAKPPRYTFAFFTKKNTVLVELRLTWRRWPRDWPGGAG